MFSQNCHFPFLWPCKSKRKDLPSTHPMLSSRGEKALWFPMSFPTSGVWCSQVWRASTIPIFQPLLKNTIKQAIVPWIGPNVAQVKLYWFQHVCNFILVHNQPNLEYLPPGRSGHVPRTQLPMLYPWLTLNCSWIWSARTAAELALHFAGEVGWFDNPRISPGGYFNSSFFSKTPS